MAEALIKYETINGEQIDQIMDGHEPDPPADWNESEPGPTGDKDDASNTDKRPTIGGPAEQV
jgi:cell division protease FtsH